MTSRINNQNNSIVNEPGNFSPENIVDGYTDWLIDHGAIPVEQSFRVATQGQTEVILQDRRYLLTPNDEAYNSYVEVMGRADLPAVLNSAGDRSVVIAEIPREARALPQIMRSRQPRGGEIIRDVFEVVGRSLDIMTRATNLAPKTGMLALRKIMIVPSEREIMFIPPLEFEPVEAQTKQKLVERMQDELLPEYAHFGAATLLQAFKKGINDDSRE